MLTTALCAPYSINHFSNWMLFHTSRWLTHSLCLVRVSRLPTPTSTRVPAACSAASASNNVIKPPHSLWPPPMPCCALTLFFFFSSPKEMGTAVCLPNHKADTKARPTPLYTVFWTNPSWQKEEESLYALKWSSNSEVVECMTCHTYSLS